MNSFAERVIRIQLQYEKKCRARMEAYHARRAAHLCVNCGDPVKDSGKCVCHECDHWIKFKERERKKQRMING